MITIGLDIGTTTISGLLYDLDTRTILHSITQQQASTPSSRTEVWERLQEPELMLRQAEAILGSLLSLAPDAAGIGISGQMHGIVYIDQTGNACSPLYTWQDGRGALPYEGDYSFTYAEQISRLTGYSIAPGYGLATHYYNQCCGLVPPEAASFCTIADYIAVKLAGIPVPLMDATQSAGIGGFSHDKGDFDRIALEQAGIDVALLPRVVPSGTALGVTTQGIPVYPSLGDNQASFTGSVPQPETSVLINIGTGSQLSAWLPEYSSAPSSMEVRPYPGGGVLLVGAALSGGKSYALLEVFYRNLISAYTGHDPGEMYPLMKTLLDRQPAIDGLSVITQFLGTRTDPGQRGSITGISLDNFTPAGLTHAFLQGMVDELHGFLAVLEKQTTRPFSRLIGSGNALRNNPALCAKAEATFGLPLLLAPAVEGAAAGAALYAAVGSGGIPSFREAGSFLQGSCK
ncbi:FGGY family carbohydrate kinase [Paenibacillus sp. MMS20-IR301]|uniref:sedoheptulokinase n=1 Tax=Paenibacillus sp. MMS20-IR301 TaxID=2895946 RepID=UPI0028EFEC74|nr:FGGY family carbohydrate kinase [Paenibacillus sp. MMS20-IR301]WNS45362.1 FGGY family carbohydrate kinase [Paenibacillus sp. MMS20-IR301]